jgi:phage terminase large subunit GpA-like protein
MHNLQRQFLERLRAGLDRASVDRCSRWAMRYRMMGKPFTGPFTFDHHPWTKDMHDSDADFNVGQKAAQMGYTETILNWVFYNIDIRGESCLYILPTSDDAGDFSASRFDPALESSTHLENLFSDVKNIGLKRAGSAVLYVRGSRSKSKLRSIPAGKIVFDEVDVMQQENIPLALERASGQLDKQVWMISTPTVEGLGINGYYINTTQEHYFFRCPHCSKLIEMTFPDNIIITTDNPYKTADSYYICNLCKKPLPAPITPLLLESGNWVPQFNDADARGFYINQMYSPTISPAEIAKAYLLSLTNPADEQEFYNSKLGLTHTVENAKICDENLKKCFKDYKNGTIPTINNIITMGIDVGKWLHFEIDEWINVDGEYIPRVVAIGKKSEFHELSEIMKKYYVSYAVIDANPERRKALEFCQQNMASMCFYGREVKSKEIIDSTELPAVTIDRNSWLDLSLGRLLTGKILLPVDTPIEYQSHVKNIVKIYEKDANGNVISRWINGTKDDHHAHARNYAEVALHKALSMGSHESITGLL